MDHRRTMICGLSATLLFAAAPAVAQSVDGSTLQSLREELDLLMDEQLKRSSEAAVAQKRIESLELRLNAIAADTPSASRAQAARPRVEIEATRTGNGSLEAIPQSAIALADAMQINGDVRLRYEMNPDGGAVRSRSRGVLRARLRGSYSLTKEISVGAQLVTGDPDDPNSSDVTLSNFADDFSLSLDQAYVRWARDEFELTGGKFVNPFVRTDLVWDSDVHPQGLSAAWSRKFDQRAGISVKALYFAVDEAVAGPDSSMVGAQATLQLQPLGTIQVELAVAYYDYSLKSISGADVGDFRSNFRRADGSYLSDFNILDSIATLTYDGLGQRWPIRISADVVRNLGSATTKDSGYSIDVAVGRTSVPREWRITYGHAVAETDAVLAAFSHDNTALATNYIQHSIVADYALHRGVMLNLSAFRYRLKSAFGLNDVDLSHWLNRVRVNLLFSF